MEGPKISKFGKLKVILGFLIWMSVFNWIIFDSVKIINARFNTVEGVVTASIATPGSGNARDPEPPNSDIVFEYAYGGEVRAGKANLDEFLEVGDEIELSLDANGSVEHINPGRQPVEMLYIVFLIMYTLYLRVTAEDPDNWCASELVEFNDQALEQRKDLYLLISLVVGFITAAILNAVTLAWTELNALKMIIVIVSVLVSARLLTGTGAGKVLGAVSVMQVIVYGFLSFEKAIWLYINTISGVFFLALASYFVIRIFRRRWIRLGMPKRKEN